MERSDEERQALVEYMKALAHRDKVGPPVEPIPPGGEPPVLTEEQRYALHRVAVTGRRWEELRDSWFNASVLPRSP